MNTGLFIGDNYLLERNALAWPPNRLFLPEKTQIAETLSPALRDITAVDSGRTWSTAQNIGVNFSEAVTGNATGWSATINGVAKTLTYVSGSGTPHWVFTIGGLLRNGDVLRLTYNTATGNTVSTSGSVEITGVNNVPFANQLSKRVRFILCDSADAVVANEAVKSAILEYGGGVVSADAWASRANKATVTTAADGQFDALYTGTASVGGTVYAVVFRAVESLAVAAAVT